MMPTVAEILKEHVVLDVECFDRLYLNGYIPSLQTEGQLTYFLTRHLGNKIASPALLGRITTDFVKAVETFIRDQDIPRVDFKKKDRKDTIANDLRKRDPRRDVVVFVGVAQEKQQAFKGKKVRDPESGYVNFWYSRQPAFVKQYYFYIDDADFGPCFIKIGTYAPFPVRICINGHEWAKRHIEKKGIAYEALDNGFLRCGNHEALQQICDSVGPDQIEAFFRKWLGRLPFLDAGFWMLDAGSETRSCTARSIQHPESSIQHRAASPSTPSSFRSRIITRGVSPSLHVEYKSTDIKQYFKENRAARTECTINNPKDFGVNKRLKNLPYLKQIARNAVRRLLEVEHVTEDCTLSEASVERLTQPTLTDEGHRATGFRFGDPRVMALFAALTLFLHLPNGFRNRELRKYVSDLLDVDSSAYHAGKMTYDLRRLRLKGIIARQPRTTRYFLTPYGYRVALFMTRLHARLFRPGFASLNPDPGVHVPHPLRRAMDKVNVEIDTLIERSHLKQKKAA
jgi:hypothetical protein